MTFIFPIWGHVVLQLVWPEKCLFSVTLTNIFYSDLQVITEPVSTKQRLRKKSLWRKFFQFKWVLLPRVTCFRVPGWLHCWDIHLWRINYCYNKLQFIYRTTPSSLFLWKTKTTLSRVPYIHSSQMSIKTDVTQWLLNCFFIKILAPQEKVEIHSISQY